MTLRCMENGMSECFMKITSLIDADLIISWDFLLVVRIFGRTGNAMTQLGSIITYLLINYTFVFRNR